MVGIATLLGRLGPGKLWLGQILLAVQRHVITNDRIAQGQLDFADSKKRVVIPEDHVLVVNPQPDSYDGLGTQAYR